MVVSLHASQAAVHATMLAPQIGDQIIATVSFKKYFQPEKQLTAEFFKDVRRLKLEF